MRKTLLAAVMLLAGLVAFAQDKPAYNYVDAAQFPLYGKAVENTSERYTRLPAALEGVLRKDLWDLSRDAAGLCIRFRTDSKVIRARWNSIHCMVMNHMTPTGIRGLDLYALCEDGWRFAGTARPSRDRHSDVKIISGMNGEMREYMLYLPLYDGVQDLEIGVDQGAVIEAPAVDFPSREKPVVMYGTSILQGGCANRAGMASSNILSRRLGREVINLGFSGNARLDYEIAEIMAAVPDPGVYVMDNVPNSSPERIHERTETFFRMLRDAHPNVPVIFVEDPLFPHMRFDADMYKEITGKNQALREEYEKLRKAGHKNIYYISSEKMIGNDGEATVDGVHFTDLGMVRYVELVEPVIRKALKKNR